MPLWEAQTPDGQTVTLDLDHEPTEQELASVFEDLGRATAAAPPPPPLPGIKLTPYEQAEIASFERGQGKPLTGMEPGTELTAALGQATNIPEIGEFLGGQVIGPAVEHVARSWEATGGMRDPLAGLEMLTKPAIQAGGQVLRKQGEAVLGAIEDPLKGPIYNPETGKYESAIIPWNLLAGPEYETPAYFTGAESPHARQIARLEAEGVSPWALAPTRTVRGLIEATPRMAAQAALGPVAGPAVWGVTEEGFDPATAATMYVLPWAKRYSGALAENVASKLGVSDDVAQQLINRAAGGTAMAGLLTADQIYQISQMPEEERSKLLPEALGSAIAMFAMGALEGKGRMQFQGQLDRDYARRLDEYLQRHAQDVARQAGLPEYAQRGAPGMGEIPIPQIEAGVPFSRARQQVESAAAAMRQQPRPPRPTVPGEGEPIPEPPVPPPPPTIPTELTQYPEMLDMMARLFREGGPEGWRLSIDEIRDMFRDQFPNMSRQTARELGKKAFGDKFRPSDEPLPAPVPELRLPETIAGTEPAPPAAAGTRVPNTPQKFSYTDAKGTTFTRTITRDPQDPTKWRVSEFEKFADEPEMTATGHRVFDTWEQAYKNVTERIGEEKPVPEPAATAKPRTLTPAVRADKGTDIETDIDHGTARLKHARAGRIAFLPQNEGFVDENGNWLTRKEAAERFFEITGKRPNIPDALQSEDLKRSGMLEHLRKPEAPLPPVEPASVKGGASEDLPADAKAQEAAAKAEQKRIADEFKAALAAKAAAAGKPVTPVTPPETPVPEPTLPRAPAPLLEVPAEKLSLEARRQEIMRKLARIDEIPEWQQDENIESARKRLQGSLDEVERQLLSRAKAVKPPTEITEKGVIPSEKEETQVPEVGTKTGAVTAPTDRPAGDLTGLSEGDIDAILDEASGKPTTPAPAPAQGPDIIQIGDWVEYQDSSGNTHQGKVDKAWSSAVIVPTSTGVKTRKIKHSFSIVDASGNPMRSPREGVPLKRIAAPTPQPAAPPTKTAAQIIADAAASGVKGIDETIKGLHDLFGGGKMVGMGPAFDEKTYAQAKVHFRQAYKSFTDSGRSLKDFAKFIFDKFGEAVRPYLKQFILEMQSEAAPAAQESKDLRALIGSSKDGRQKAAQVRQMAEARGITVKEMQEIIEAEIVKWSQEAATYPGMSDEAKFEWAKGIYQRQPILSARTSTSVGDQAYSTPIPLSFALNRALGVTPRDAVYDPTAGNAALIVGGDFPSSHGNEINPSRARAMRKIGVGLVTENDATKYVPTRRFAIIKTNPPFGTIDNVNYGGYGIKKLEHLIALKALEAMEDDGKAAIIIGAKMMEAQPGAHGAQWVFENYLYGHYNVVGNFEISGDLYSRQGAAWPVRVIVVDGRRVQPIGGDLAAKSVDRFSNWDDVWNEANRIRNEIDLRRSAVGSAGGAGLPVPPEGQPPAPGKPGGVPPPTRIPVPPTGPGGVSGGVGGRQPQAPTGPRTGGAGRPAVIPTSRPEDDPTSIKPRSPRQPPPRVETPVSGTGKTPPDATGTGEAGGGAAKPGVVPGAPPLTGTEHQSPYVPRSKGNPFGTLTPKNVAAGTHGALDELIGRVGSLDDFVANRLNMNPEEVRNVMAAEQIDGVSLAIDQIERSGGGALIIGDETGIGKGRQGAAIIRYAKLNGKIPIFFTQDPKLFTDMYGDLADIHTDVKPFIMGNPVKATIRDVEDNPIHKAPGFMRQRSEMQRIEDGGWDKSGYDSIFVTYSQVNNRNARQLFLERLAQSNDVILILDEAHTSAGDASTSMQAAFMSGGRVKRGSGPDTHYIIVPGLLNAAGTLPGRGGVLYMSATYAKRSENMPVYFRTSLNQAADTFPEIVSAMRRGGVALQQAVSEALAKAGQYIRRERDFTGVTYSMKRVAPQNVDALVEQVDQVTDVLSEIVRFSQLIRERMTGGDETSTAQSEDAMSMTDFASIVHNQVGQLLLAAKADAVVEECIAAKKAGEKPVIAVMNTMESFLDHFVDDKGLKPGDRIQLRWNELLRHALERCLRTTKDNPDGSTTIGRADPYAVGLGPLYDSIVKAADAVESKFPVSPIDYIIQKLGKAGIKIHELTGRGSGIEYTNFETGEGRYARFKKANKNSVVNRFNEMEDDGMLLNASGSTGLSAHASVKVKAQKPRHMIIGQPALDINVFVQTLGRIKRTGMVMLGRDAQGQPYGAKYTHLVLPLQAETRPAAIAARKMKSLNANTTAETDTAIKIEAEDIMNKYGDRVVAEYLDEHPELQNATGIYIGHTESGAPEAYPDLARKFTGRMAIRPDAEQAEIYKAILPAYAELVEQLKSTGEYDLEVAVHDDWDGRRLSDQELVPGTDESNIFTAGVRAQEWEIRDNRHVPTGEEMRRDFEKRTGGREALMGSWKAVQQRIPQLINQKRADLNAKLAAEEAKGDKGNPTEIRNQLERLDSQEARWGDTESMVDDVVRDGGRVVQLSNSETGDVYDAVLVEARFPTIGLRIAPSNFKFRFAIDAPGGVLYLTGRDFMGGAEGPWSLERQGKNFSDLTGKKPDARYTRTFLVGNPIRGYVATGGVGKVTRFTSSDGKVITGLLMPRNWDMGKLAQDPRLDLVSGRAAEYFLRTHGGGDYYSEGTPIEAKGGIIRIGKTYGQQDSYTISVPAARRTGGEIYLDRNLLKITGDFTKTGNKMTVRIEPAKLGRAIDAISAIIKSRFRPVGKAEELIPKVSDSNKRFGAAPPPGSRGIMGDLRDRLDKGESPEGEAGGRDFTKSLVDAGRALYEKGITFADWAGRMVRELGQNIGRWLREIWTQITDLADFDVRFNPDFGSKYYIPVKIRGKDGKIYDADFNGYVDYRQLGKGFLISVGRRTGTGPMDISHGFVNPGERVLSRLPSPAKWEKLRAAAATRSAVPIPLEREALSGIPIPDITQLWSSISEKAPELPGEIRRLWKSFSMQSLPRITEANRGAGEAGVRLAASPMVARAKGIQFAANVTEGIRVPDFDKKFGTALSEDNLRDLKQKWEDRAEEAENRHELIRDLEDEIAQLHEDAADGDPSAIAEIRGMRSEIRSLSALTDEDAARFRANAENVVTMIGAENSPFPTEEAYQQFMETPEAQLALSRHIQMWENEKDPLYREANDIDPDLELPTRGLQFGARVNLKNVLRDQGTRTTVGPATRSPLIRATATLKRTDPFGREAKGSGSYEGSYQEIMANGFAREYPVAKQHEFIRQLIASGDAVVRPREFEPELEIGGESTKGYPLKLRPWANKFLHIRRSLAPEYEDASGLSAARKFGLYTKAGEIATKLSVQGLAEGSTHIANLLTQVFTGLGPTGDPLINALLKSLGRSDLIISLPKVLIGSFADRKADMLKLAEIGAAKEPYRGGVGWLITKVDHGVRLYAAEVYEKMAAKGWVPDTETGLREFVNQVGQYNKRLQPRWIQDLRTTQVQPFATAMQTFNIQGLRMLALSPGIKASSDVAAAALRADKAAAWIGFAVLVGALNMILSGSPTGPKGTKLGAVGWIDEEDKRLHQFDLGSLTGMSRGARVTGLQGFIEAKRLGLGTGEALASGVKGAANTAISSATGPANRFLFMSATGKRPSFPPIQEAPVKPPQTEKDFNALKTQAAANILEAAKQSSPLVDFSVRMKQKKYGEAFQRQFSRYTPRTGMATETIENLPKIVQLSELRDYTDALAKEAKKEPRGFKRNKFIQDRMKEDGLDPSLRRKALEYLGRAGSFTR